MRLKSHYRITLTFTLVMAVVLVGFYLYLDRKLKDYVYQRIVANVTQEVSLARNYLNRLYYPSMTLEEVDRIADHIGADLNARVTIMNLSGKVLGDSSLDSKIILKMDSLINRPEVTDSLKNGVGVSRSFSSAIGKEVSYVAALFGWDRPVGIIRLAIPLSEITLISEQLKRFLWVGLLFSFIASGVMNFFASAVISHPIEQMADSARAISQGDYSRKAAIPGDDEIAQLSRVIDVMSEQNRKRVVEVTGNKARLEAVLLSMFEGVMVVDAEGRIVLMNQTLKKLWNVGHEVAGKKPLEVIRNIEIQEMVNHILQSRGGMESRELTILLPEEKILRVHATIVTREDETDGAVFVFHDITDLRQLEMIRKDFVANVSHEFRTPVANIKGYSETLLHGAIHDQENAIDFLKIIYSESDRLAKLVDDLLQLARIESGKSILDIKVCDIREIFKWVMVGIEIQAKDKSVTVKKDFPDNLPKVKADESAVAHIFMNLLENAIKYNRPGGSVTVAAKAVGQLVEVSLTDTGLGIPADDLPRIFERFYRVDKARSRQLGGTGLGLSIVKHLVQSHGGEVSVESEAGIGSTFLFTIPIA